ncbi:hypothetical protein SBRY_10659 [Actinacidiphila bryophytorum]|uniref:Uncharacterized protein n=1 Tax=Actinacidiphila bryophytorum TaxID=1436133 RepID=A0A9W4E6N0_9ACTN|nr:hypothetical protein SBRY_10659 [Actinacidiphila bryophytorum]
MVAVVVGEAEPVVEGAGGVVVGLDLEVGGGGALAGGLPGERAHDGQGEAAPPVRRYDLDGPEERPRPVHDGPPDGAGGAGEPDGRTAGDDGECRVRKVPCAVVGGQPVRVGGAGQGDGLGCVRQQGQRRERRGPDERVGLACPSAVGGPCGVRRGVGQLEVRGRAAFAVPAFDFGERLVERQPGVADGQHGVGTPGEAAGIPEGPVAERCGLGRGPRPGGDGVEFPVRHSRNSGPAPDRCGRDDLAGHEGGFRDSDGFAGPARDLHHSLVPGCENTDRIGERGAPVSDIRQLPHGYTFSHVNGGDTDFESRTGREIRWHACPSCSVRAQERRY